jgi:tRNA-dihydrouridine synthase
MNFWQKIKKPILCLAPMADVTDAAFRYVIKKYSDIPYVTYTEFVSADGLILAPREGKKKLLKNLEYSEIERPIVAQIFGSNPEMIEKAAETIAELGFDGVDINMGCPDRAVEKQKAGAALIKNPKLAREIILAAKKGVKNNLLADKEGIPVSIKTRLGYNKDELETLLPELLAENPAAVIIHARTRKEMSKVPARWERIKRAVEIRNKLQTSPPNPLSLTRRGGKEDEGLLGGEVAKVDRTKTLIIGNGDVENIDEAYQRYKETECDGVMIGRGVFGNPWLFSGYHPTLEEKLKVLIEHSKLFEQKFAGVKNFAVMKKHFKAYLIGLSNVKKLKAKLMATNNTREVEKIINEFLAANL